MYRYGYTPGLASRQLGELSRVRAMLRNERWSGASLVCILIHLVLSPTYVYITECWHGLRLYGGLVVACKESSKVDGGNKVLRLSLFRIDRSHLPKVLIVGVGQPKMQPCIMNGFQFGYLLDGDGWIGWTEVEGTLELPPL